MKKITLFAYILVLVMLAVNIYRLSQLQQNRKILKAYVEKALLNEEIIRKHEENIVLQLRTEGTSLNLDKIMLAGRNIDTLINLIKSKTSVLVFRYSKMNCQTCVDNQLKMIRQMLPKNKKVIFLSRYNSARDLYQFKRINQIYTPIYVLNEAVTPIDTLNVPYFFCLTNQGVIDKVFIPIGLNQNLTKQYLEKVANIL